MILEPVQNAGGCFTPQDGYFQRVREICDRHGVLLISDEVICAWGRLGHYFGSERYGYVPDMITTAKGLTSAYSPMGALIVADRVAEPFMHGTAMFVHGFTFGGHPVSAAVALANLEIMRREDLCGRVRDQEPAFRAMLDGLRDLAIVGDVRGAGYFHAIELVKDKETKETFDADESEHLLRGFLSGELFARGLICRADDRGDPVIQLAAAPDRRARAVRRDRGHPPRRAHRRLGPARPPLMLTVERLVAEVGLALATGAASGATRVRWVHCTELADPTPWLTGGELLLTTGDRLDDPETQRSYIRRLVEHGIAGVGLGTGFAHERLPPALLAAADAAAFPVFEVPYALPFIAITERAAVHLVDEHLDALRRGMAIQARIERLVLDERGLEEVVRVVAAAIGGSAGVLDGRGEVLAWHDAGPGEPPRAAREAMLQAVAAVSGPPPPDLEPPGGDGRALALPVVARRGAPAAAWLVAVGSAALGEFERLVLRQTVTVVALELMRLRVVRDTERRLAGDVFAEALTGRLHPEELETRLRPFGLGSELAVLAFALRDPPAAAPVLDRALERLEVPALVAVRGPLLCAVTGVPAPDRARRAPAPRAGRPFGDVRAAASRPGPAQRAAPELPRGALRPRGGSPRQRRRPRGRLPPRPRRLPAPALAPGRRGPELLLRLACSARSRRSRADYGDELMRSLEVFIEHNGHWERAAGELYCHRHTLRYRISRVEELTGRDLSSARDRIEFWLALRGRELGAAPEGSEHESASHGDQDRRVPGRADPGRRARADRRTATRWSSRPAPARAAAITDDDYAAQGATDRCPTPTRCSPRPS